MRPWRRRHRHAPGVGAGCGGRVTGHALCLVAVPAAGILERLSARLDAAARLLGVG